MSLVQLIPHTDHRSLDKAIEEQRLYNGEPTYYNVFVDTRDGTHKTMFGRSREGAAWERDAVLNGYWYRMINDHKHWKPAYMIVVFPRRKQ